MLYNNVTCSHRNLFDFFIYQAPLSSLRITTRFSTYTHHSSRSIPSSHVRQEHSLPVPKKKGSHTRDEINFTAGANPSLMSCCAWRFSVPNFNVFLHVVVVVILVVRPRISFLRRRTLTFSNLDEGTLPATVFGRNRQGGIQPPPTYNEASGFPRTTLCIPWDPHAFSH